MADLQDKRQGAAVEHLLGARGLLELLTNRQLDAPLEVGQDKRILLHDDLVGIRNAAQLCQYAHTLGIASLFSEPSRRLVLGEHASDEKDAGKELERKSGAPLLRYVDAVAVLLEQPVVGPEGKGDTEDDGELVHAGETTTDEAGGGLGDVGGDDDGDDADSVASDRAADIQLECGVS
jgi:hypothetical protein